MNPTRAALLSFTLLLPALCQAQEQARPRLAPQDVAVLAATCFTCHGPHGQPPGNLPDGIPRLQGRSSDFLLQRLRAFKAMGHEKWPPRSPTSCGPLPPEGVISSSWEHPCDEKSDANATIMPLLMQGYDDAQIEALALWFAREGRP